MMDLEAYKQELKGFIYDLHTSHGGSGDGLSCTICVLAILDKVQTERSTLNGKRFFEGQF